MSHSENFNSYLVFATIVYIMMLFLVKFTHSLILVGLLIALYVVWMYALHGMFWHWWRWAVAAIVLEAVVWVGYGWRCPLTDWAIALGDDTGADYITEWLIVSPVNYVMSYAIFASCGILLALRRNYLEQKV